MFEQTHYEGKKIVNRECRFAVYVPPPNFSDPDLHVVKEVLHLEDGTRVPNLQHVWDYQRPYWMVKQGQRTFVQYLDYIEEDRCQKFMTNQTKLIASIGRQIGRPKFQGSLRDVCTSPYVFGADIKSTACIKKDYKRKYPDINTEFSVAVFDIETDVVHGTEEAIMATLSFKDRVLTVVKKSFVKGILDVERKLYILLEKYIGDVVKQRGVKVEFVFVDQEIDIYVNAFGRAHELKPDFMAIWNQMFDVREFIKACDRAGVDPASIICDPSVPDEYKYFRFKIGPSQKKTAKGLIMPIKRAAQWHTAFFPASFYIMDSMCAYRHTRQGKQEESSYALDAILKRNNIGGKLKFAEADGYTDLAWHEFMQANYPLEYIIYNIYDCIGVEILDEKVKDLAVVISQFSDTSDFEDFKSQPRRKCDELHWFFLEHGFVIGTTNSSLHGDMEKRILGREDWIITLANALVEKYGLKVIQENPELITTIFAHVGDLDVSASYPTGECAFNMSRRTTKRELCRIFGISEDEVRMQGMGLSAGHVNSLEYSMSMFKAAELPTLAKMFEADLAAGKVEGAVVETTQMLIPSVYVD
jgi:hypothetical protein